MRIPTFNTTQLRNIITLSKPRAKFYNWLQVFMGVRDLEVVIDQLTDQLEDLGNDLCHERDERESLERQIEDLSEGDILSNVDVTEHVDADELLSEVNMNDYIDTYALTNDIADDIKQLVRDDIQERLAAAFGHSHH